MDIGRENCCSCGGVSTTDVLKFPHTCVKFVEVVVYSPLDCDTGSFSNSTSRMQRVGRDPEFSKFSLGELLPHLRESPVNNPVEKIVGLPANFQLAAVPSPENEFPVVAKSPVVGDAMEDYPVLRSPKFGLGMENPVEPQSQNVGVGMEKLVDPQL